MEFVCFSVIAKKTATTATPPMVRSFIASCILASVAGLAAAEPAEAGLISFSTGDPDGLIGIATRPASGGAFEIETADDFVLGTDASLTSATFFGLVPSGSSPIDVVIEIYRVFPNDSDLGRTSGGPTFSTAQVPTRVNSPSDTAVESRDNSGGSLSFATSTLQASFTVNNSIRPGGIHATPNQTTGGDGAVTGQEVEFSVTFTVPIDLAAAHYFFVPQVALDSGDFLWLSAPRPIVPTGTPFAPDLEAWTRDQNLDPDWLRVGTDIVGGTTAPKFNAAFSLAGTSQDVEVGEPASLTLFSAGLLGLAFFGRQRPSRRLPRPGAKGA